jgi:hypothetical protein
LDLVSTIGLMINWSSQRLLSSYGTAFNLLKQRAGKDWLVGCDSDAFTT